MQYWPNGLGEALGDVLAVGVPAYVSGDVWFVNSATGTDASAPAGKDRQRPLATLAQAVTNAAAGDIVLLEAGHTETLTARIDINSQITIVGGGAVGGVPSVSFVPNAVNQAAGFRGTINLIAAGSEIRNVRMRESTVTVPAASNGKITMGATAKSRVIGCQFDMGGADGTSVAGLLVVNGPSRVESCRFISTATAPSATPFRGLSFSNSSPDVEIYNCTFDDGIYGYASGAAFLQGTRLRLINSALLNGADVTVFAGTTGLASGWTGGGQVNWT